MTAIIQVPSRLMGADIQEKLFPLYPSTSCSEQPQDNVNVARRECFLSTTSIVEG